jgi:hypothetical protein
MPIDFFCASHILGYGRSIQAAYTFQEEYCWIAREKGRYKELGSSIKKTNPGELTLII